MSVKAQIQADFITAMKEKYETAKAALSGLKAKITEAEKANGNQELTDDAVIKVINTAIKQRKESADAFTNGNRPELAAKELSEVEVFTKYLPAQMSEAEIETAVNALIIAAGDTKLPAQALIGKIMGAFNKQYVGRADAQTLKAVITRIVNGN